MRHLFILLVSCAFLSLSGLGVAQSADTSWQPSVTTTTTATATKTSSTAATQTPAKKKVKKKTKTKTTTKTKQAAPKLSAEEDPDGDNNNKGANLFPLTRPATGNRVFIFDPKLTAWAAYNESGDRVNTGKASGGKMFCPDVRRACKTVVGSFQVISKGGAGCKSRVYPLETNGGAPMPYCMKFHKKGYAVHGSNDVPNHNASHGCIRVTPKAAKWLSQNFIQNGTTVIVRSY